MSASATQLHAWMDVKDPGMLQESPKQGRWHMGLNPHGIMLQAETKWRNDAIIAQLINISHCFL
jgi:hypothetical protein